MPIFGEHMEIRIENIRKKYGKKTVLDGVTFSAVSGECIGILGANGCGKSTLLSILAGVQSADGGDFIYDEVSLFKSNDKRRELVGYVPQGTPLLFELTALDNLRLWYDKRELKASLEGGMLKSLGIDEFLKTPVCKMSGGMKKRLSIGCGVANSPHILILDEPTAALDLICKEQISEFIMEHKKLGGIVLLTTHDESELKICDKIYVIKDGRAVLIDYNGSTKTLAEMF